jgi:hypothetical protein
MRALTHHSRGNRTLLIVHNFSIRNATAIGNHNQRRGQCLLHAVHLVLHLRGRPTLPGFDAGADPALSGRGFSRSGEFAHQRTVVNDITQFGQAGFRGLKADTTKSTLLRDMDMANRRRVRGECRPNTEPLQNQTGAVGESQRPRIAACRAARFQQHHAPAGRLQSKRQRATDRTAADNYHIGGFSFGGNDPGRISHDAHASGLRYP